MTEPLEPQSPAPLAGRPDAPSRADAPSRRDAPSRADAPSLAGGAESAVRASDSERQAIADRLNAAVGEGRLTLEEFSDRVGSAYAARTHGELEPLVADLPTPAGRSSVVVNAHLVPLEPQPAPLDIKVGAIKRFGRWRLKKDNALGVALGPIKLDLRGADLAAREITLSARTVIGAIKVWVPRGVRVEVEGTTAVGTRTVVESNLPPELDVPTLRLRLDTWMGTVKVYRTGDHHDQGRYQA